MQVELKPCPFCGGEPQYSEFQDVLTGEVLADIMCSANCLVYPVIFEHPKDEAVAAWNTRVGDSDAS